MCLLNWFERTVGGERLRGIIFLDKKIPQQSKKIIRALFRGICCVTSHLRVCCAKGRVFIFLTSHQQRSQEKTRQYLHTVVGNL